MGYLEKCLFWRFSRGQWYDSSGGIHALDLIPETMIPTLPPASLGAALTAASGIGVPCALTDEADYPRILLPLTLTYNSCFIYNICKDRPDDVIVLSVDILIFRFQLPYINQVCRCWRLQWEKIIIFTQIYPLSLFSFWCSWLPSVSLKKKKSLAVLLESIC